MTELLLLFFVCCWLNGHPWIEAKVRKRVLCRTRHTARYNSIKLYTLFAHICSDDGFTFWSAKIMQSRFTLVFLGTHCMCQSLGAWHELHETNENFLLATWARRRDVCECFECFHQFDASKANRLFVYVDESVFTVCLYHRDFGISLLLYCSIIVDFMRRRDPPETGFRVDRFSRESKNATAIAAQRLKACEMACVAYINCISVNVHMGYTTTTYHRCWNIHIHHCTSDLFSNSKRFLKCSRFVFSFFFYSRYFSPQR